MIIQRLKKTTSSKPGHNSGISKKKYATRKESEAEKKNEKTCLVCKKKRTLRQLKLLEKNAKKSVRVADIVRMDIIKASLSKIEAPD